MLDDVAQIHRLMCLLTVLRIGPHAIDDACHALGLLGDFTGSLVNHRILAAAAQVKRQAVGVIDEACHRLAQFVRDHARNFRDKTRTLQLRESFAVNAGSLFKFRLLIDHFHELFGAARHGAAHSKAVEHGGSQEKHADQKRILVAIDHHARAGHSDGRTIAQALDQMASFTQIRTDGPPVSRLAHRHGKERRGKSALDVG